MSICLIGFVIGVFYDKSTYTIKCCILQELVILLGGVSDCEELVGVTHRR